MFVGFLDPTTFILLLDPRNIMKRKISQGDSKRISRKRKQIKIPNLNVSVQRVNPENIDEVIDFMTQEGPVVNPDGSISIFSPGEFECSPEFEKIMKSNNE